MLNLHKAIASALGIGFIPKGSGTFGALLACGIIAIIAKFTQDVHYQWVLVLLTLISTFVGWWSSGVMEHYWGEDASKIVIDEVAGMFLTVCFVAFSWQNLAIGFLLFRVFDIFKPFNIRYFEKYPNGWGVMLDDIAAGVWANGCLQIIIFFL